MTIEKLLRKRVLKINNLDKLISEYVYLKENIDIIKTVIENSDDPQLEQQLIKLNKEASVLQDKIQYLKRLN